MATRPLASGLPDPAIRQNPPVSGQSGIRSHRFIEGFPLANHFRGEAQNGEATVFKLAVFANVVRESRSACVAASRENSAFDFDDHVLFTPNEVGSPLAARNQFLLALRQRKVGKGFPLTVEMFLAFALR